MIVSLVRVVCLFVYDGAIVRALCCLCAYPPPYLIATQKNRTAKKVWSVCVSFAVAMPKSASRYELLFLHSGCVSCHACDHFCFLSSAFSLCLSSFRSSCFVLPLFSPLCTPQKMNGRFFDGRAIEAAFWDGETDYTVKETRADMDRRLDEFGQWLETQDADV